MKDNSGRFQKGNPGGPGRPARQVARDYLDTLSDAVTPDDWRKIVERARDDAMNGNEKARDWLTRYLLGNMTLYELARREALGIESEHELAAEVEKANGPPDELTQITSESDPNNVPILEGARRIAAS